MFNLCMAGAENQHAAKNLKKRFLPRSALGCLFPLFLIVLFLTWFISSYFHVVFITSMKQLFHHHTVARTDDK